MIAELSAAAIIATITCYAPGSGDGISGGSRMANGEAPYIGAAACPPSLPFGTRVTLTGKAATRARALRLPVTLTCADRFGDPAHVGIDIAVPVGFAGLSHVERIEACKVYGKLRGQRVEVEVSGE